MHGNEIIKDNLCYFFTFGGLSIFIDNIFFNNKVYSMHSFAVHSFSY